MPTFVSDEVVTATKLNNGTPRDWTTWTPTLTNLTLGSGTVTARYCQLGSELVFGYFNFLLGSGSAVGTGPTISLPVAAAASYPAGNSVSVVKYNDANGPDWVGTMAVAAGGGSTSGSFLYVDGASVTANVTATVPFTWVSTDSIWVQFWYEI